MNRRLIIGIFLASVFAVALPIRPADAHWDMEPRFWAEKTQERFFLRIHNGAHANRKASRKEMMVCFWLERAKGASYEKVSEKKCSEAVMEPDAWMNFVFALKEAVLHDEAKRGSKLKPGNYRAVAMAREQKGKVAKIFFGAALERLYTYFTVK